MVEKYAANQGFGNKDIILETVEAGKNISTETIGPDMEEPNKLELEERKRKRIGPHTVMDSNNNFEITKPDFGLSTGDYSESSSTLLAKLAQQASHKQ